MERTRAIKRVLWVVLVLNLAVAGDKLAVGFSLDALAVIADGFHSILDGSSNVIGLVGIFLASRPPDFDHPYGHQKYEAVSALGIALLLGVTALEVVQAGIERIASDTRPESSALGFLVMGGTLGVNLFVTRYEVHQGRRLHSEILLADAAHTRSDIFVSLSVLASLILVWMKWYWADVVVAFFVAGLILYVSYGILKRVSSVLMDTAPLSTAEIHEVAMGISGVRSTSNIRSRGSMPHLFIDMEIQLDPALPLWRAHEIAHEVRDRCITCLQAHDVVVHVEPGIRSAETPTREP